MHGPIIYKLNAYMYYTAYELGLAQYHALTKNVRQAFIQLPCHRTQSYENDEVGVIEI